MHDDPTACRVDELQSIIDRAGEVLRLVDCPRLAYDLGKLGALGAEVCEVTDRMVRALEVNRHAAEILAEACTADAGPDGAGGDDGR